MFEDILDHKQYPIHNHDICTFDASSIYADRPLIISLSGGVDSMVLLDLVLKRFPTSKVCAVHINYNNRPTSGLEEMFVCWWCHKQGVRIYVRRIDEISRPQCMTLNLRDVYETYTRNVRFGCYHTVCQLLACEATLNEEHPPLVLLGHNKDDCFENIMTNVATRSKYENLKGMSMQSTQDGITFIRPLLHVFKEHIIVYARHHDIPFLYDSTPSWCQRGQIRDNIVPTLRAWNPICVDTFVELSDVVTDLHAFMAEIVRQYVQTIVTIKSAHNAAVYKMATLGRTVYRSAIFWRLFIQEAFGITISHASVQHFLIRMTNIHDNARKVVLHKRL